MRKKDTKNAPIRISCCGNEDNPYLFKLKKKERKEGGERKKGREKVSVEEKDEKGKDLRDTQVDS